MGEPLVLEPTLNQPFVGVEAGFWRRAAHADEDLYEALVALMDGNGHRIALLQRALDHELPAEDGDRLASAIGWLDSQVAWMGRLVGEADALLDVAEGHFLPPVGRCVIATDEEGRMIPGNSKGVAFMRGEEPANFEPKWVALTTNDREVECARRCVAFRRLRNEYGSMEKGLTSKLYKASDLLQELRARHRAAGVAERPR